MRTQPGGDGYPDNEETGCAKLDPLLGRAITIVLIVLFVASVWYIDDRMERKEIRSVDYELINMMVNRNPDLAPFVEERMSDGKISSEEMWEIFDEDDLQDLINAKKELKRKF